MAAVTHMAVWRPMTAAGVARLTAKPPLTIRERLFRQIPSDSRHRPEIRRETRVIPMARRCELSGKAVQAGNNVSHANNRTRRRFLPNLNRVTLISDALAQSVRLRITSHALRTVEQRGGLDNFLAKADDKDLSMRARRLKRKIARRQAAGSMI